MTSEYLGLHANRAHLAAREEGLDRGVAIVLGGAVGRRLAILRRGHAENEGGGARVVSGERDGEVHTTMAKQTGARAAVAPPMMALAIWVLVSVSGPSAL
jgi:hypothetical protein